MNEEHTSPEKNTELQEEAGGIATTTDTPADLNEGEKSSRSINEIDLLDILTQIWAGKKKILLITAVFTAFGLFHYHFGPEDYQSESVLIQETEGGDAGTLDILSRLGGGFNVPTGGAVSATARGYAPPPLFLYRDIISSTGFLQDLIHREVEFETLGGEVSLYTYFNEYEEPPVRDQVYDVVLDYTIKLPITIFRGITRGVRNLFRGEAEASNPSGEEMQELEPVVLDERLRDVSRRENRVMNAMRERVDLNIGSGLTTIRVRLPDPKAAALVNAYLIEHIQEYMTNYRVEKARDNLEFVLESHERARERYEEAQMALADFQDANVNLTSQRARTQLEYLQNERNRLFNVYNTLSEQVEQARLTLQQQTPVFNVLEKPNVPENPYTGVSEFILIFSIILGILTGIGWVLFRDAIYKLIARYRR